MQMWFVTVREGFYVYNLHKSKKLDLIELIRLMILLDILIIYLPSITLNLTNLSQIYKMYIRQNWTFTIKTTYKYTKEKNLFSNQYTNVLYLIRHASVILIVGLHM